MVHALREAERVLVPKGTLVDLRPLSTSFPIDAVSESCEIRMGTADGTATVADDRAADRAMAMEVESGRLLPRCRTELEVRYYWDTTADMADWMRTGRAVKPVTPSYTEIEDALRAARAGGAPVRLRGTRRLVLASYTKG